MHYIESWFWIPEDKIKYMDENLISLETVQKRVYWLRGHKVMLSTDLAELYETEARKLIQAVKRNLERFPDDFMFQLNEKEFRNLRSQIVISNSGGNRYAPYAFTEQGVAMLSSILHSKRAIQVNIQIMRTFVKLRELIDTNKDLAIRLEVLESRYDEQFKIVFDAIRELMEPVKDSKKPIGFSI